MNRNVFANIIKRLPVACAPGACLLLLLGAACSQPATNNASDNTVDEHRDHWRPRESQSDFLDIGKQAGIEWLSFYPQDQLDYPAYFEGLDRDQKNRLRLAPKGSDEQVLIQFDLPKGSKLWPVDWYGTELMAIDLPARNSFSLAIAKTALNPQQAAEALAGERQRHLNRTYPDDRFVLTGLRASDDYGACIVVSKSRWVAAYVTAQMTGRTGRWLVVTEHIRPWAYGSEPADSRTYPDDSPGLFELGDLMTDLVSRVSIKRELALEGSPKHKCSSSLEEQLIGTLRFPNGTLQLPITDGQLVRKIGGDSTIQIDGDGAKPWILIRRLKESDAEGDIRARLRRDTTFLRRTKVPSAKFSKGFTPQGAKLPIVAFDYDDSSAENQLVGVIKAGDELLTFEVVTQGVTDGDARRAAKSAALKLLAGASAEQPTSAPEFEPLIGWNANTMGSND